ncbi:MAG: hypothetical protein ABH864_04260 [archaeon]
MNMNGPMATAGVIAALIGAGRIDSAGLTWDELSDEARQAYHLGQKIIDIKADPMGISHAIFGESTIAHFMADKPATRYSSGEGMSWSQVKAFAGRKLDEMQDRYGALTANQGVPAELIAADQANTNANNGLVFLAAGAALTTLGLAGQRRRYDQPNPEPSIDRCSSLPVSAAHPYFLPTAE